MIKTVDLSVSFGRHTALSQVGLSLPDRGLVGLYGPNGSGKSTFLDVLSGFVGASSGYVALGATARPSPARRLRRAAARLHQTRVLPEELSVARYLRLAASPPMSTWVIGRAAQGPPIESRLVELLSCVGVRLDDRLGTLSWGQARIAAMGACCLAPKSYLLLDEPFVGLSASSSAAARQFVADEASSRLVIVSDHDLAQFQAESQTTVVLVRGRVAFAGPSAELEGRELYSLVSQ